MPPMLELYHHGSSGQVRIWTKAVDEELHPACSTITHVVSHRHTILRNGAGSFDEFLRLGSRQVDPACNSV